MKKIIAVLLVFGLLSPSVSAQTIAELQAQIELLMAQISQLQANQTVTVTPSTPVTYYRNLSLGMSGGDVTSLQIELGGGGFYDGPITGYFGTLTQEAVRRFQADNGIDTTGFVGPLTRGVLDTLSGRNDPPFTGGDDNVSTIVLPSAVLTSSKNLITKGQNAELTLTSSPNAVSCNITFTSGWNSKTSGKITVEPTVNTTYIATCRNSNGQLSAITPASTVTITVVDPYTPPPPGTGKPDLIPSLPPQTTATVGTPTNFTSIITNSGSVGTVANFDNNFEVAAGAGGSGSITTLTPAFMSALGTGGSSTATSPRHTFASAGTYSVRACSDSYKVISESNETNNCSPWRNVTVAVNPPDVTTKAVDIKANGSDGPISVPLNSTVTVKWTSTGATSCQLGYGSTNLPRPGLSSSMVSPPITAPTTFTFICDGISDSVTVNPNTGSTARITVTQSHTSIPSGQSPLITFTGYNVVFCSASSGYNSGAANNYLGPRTIQFSIHYPHTTTTTHTGTCTDASGGTHTAKATIQVTAATAPVVTPTTPTIIAFYADPNPVIAGHLHTLAASVKNATQCKVAKGNTELAGATTKTSNWTGDWLYWNSNSVSTPLTTTYTITCVNGALSASKSIVVTAVNESANAYQAVFDGLQALMQSLSE